MAFHWRIAVAAALIALSSAVGAFTATGGKGPGVRECDITAEKYAYEPFRIVVDRGDEVHIRLGSLDAVHGFYVEGHDVEAMIFPGRAGVAVRHPATEDGYRQEEEIVFPADRTGKFRYRCSVTCGTLHPFMLGEIIVRPNRFHAACQGAAGGILLAAIFLAFTATRRPGGGNTKPKQMDLLALFPLLGRFVRKPWFQFLFTFPFSLFLVFLLIAGFFGSPIGNRNIIIVFVWIFWWFLLITFLVPLGGRVWCMACPFPFFGEWIQRRRPFGRPDRMSTPVIPHPGGLNRKWPAPFSNTWFPNLVFLTMCTFSAILLTRPQVTAAVLGALVLTATLVHYVFPGRTFCMYLCPLNGWISLYSMSAATGVRPRDPGACGKCSSYSCRMGTDRAWSCPWFQKPGLLTRNNHCGLCMECITACERSNMTVIARPFFSDTVVENLSEAWTGFIMISLAFVYSVVLLGPWPVPKEWANFTESGNWRGFLVYAAAVWSLSLVVIPAFWWFASRLGRRLSGGGRRIRTIFMRSSYMLVPLGLFAWMAFTIPLMFLDFSYIVSSISDPMGWGWDLFGTARLEWEPFHPEWIVPIQSFLLLIGLGVSLERGYSVTRNMEPHLDKGGTVLRNLPHAALCTGFTMVLLRLFAG